MTWEWPFSDENISNKSAYVFLFFCWICWKCYFYFRLVIGFRVYVSTGTAIDQGEAPEFYFQKYPEDNPVLGFFTWKWILTLGFDHMFSSPLFLGMLVLLGASLIACTYTTQIPLVKVARRYLLYFWKLLSSSSSGSKWLNKIYVFTLTAIDGHVQMGVFTLSWCHSQAGI